MLGRRKNRAGWGRECEQRNVSAGREAEMPVRRFLKKTTTTKKPPALPYDPAIPLLGSRENCNSKRYIHPNVPCSTIYNSQDMDTI